MKASLREAELTERARKGKSHARPESAQSRSPQLVIDEARKRRRTDLHVSRTQENTRESTIPSRRPQQHSLSRKDLRVHLNSNKPDLRDRLEKNREKTAVTSKRTADDSGRVSESYQSEKTATSAGRGKSTKKLVGGSKFAASIQNARFRDRYKPPTLPDYDGKSDPVIHLSSFNLVTDITGATDAQKCHLLATTLKGRAHKWFHQLGSGKITSFSSFSKMLKTQFCSSQSKVRTTNSLKAIVRKEGETLKEYLQRFDNEAQEINGLISEQAASYFCDGVQNPSLVAMLKIMAKGKYHKIVSLVAEFAESYDAAEKEMRGTKKESTSQATPRDRSERRPEGPRDDRRPPPKKKAERQDRREDTIFPKYDRHAPLVMTVADVAASVGPGSLQKAWNYSDQRRFGDKQCAVHGYSNHSSNECRLLKDQIEYLYRQGQIDRFIDYEALAKERRVNRQQDEPGPSTRVIMTLDTRAKRVKKSDATASKRAKRLEAPAEEADRPLVVTMTIAGCEVRRMLVDSGSSVNVLYKGAFEQMGVDPQTVFAPNCSLAGFGGETIVPFGTTSLLVEARDGHRSSTNESNFTIVDRASPYNGIVGRPLLNALRAICSTYELYLRFPTDQGMGEIRGDPPPTSQCYVAHEGDESTPAGNPEPTVTQDSPPEDTRAIEVYQGQPDRATFIGSSLNETIATQIEELIRENKEGFAWDPSDMPGISPDIITHQLNTDPSFKPIKQKKRSCAGERKVAIQQEVDKLLEAGFIEEVAYPAWLSNVVMVKKPNGKWRMCIDFTSLNKACPKDSYPLPRIDRLVDATAGHELLSFMDAYSGYNQIQMHIPDRDKTAFITDAGTFCYKVMPFGLKNAGATYQRLVDRVFKEQIGKTMEVYVDDLVVKSLHAKDHPSDLRDVFETLKRSNMKLNPNKCSFGVTSGKFLGHMVSQRGIEPNPDKIKAIQGMKPPSSKRDIQVLAGRIAALNRFIAKTGDKCRTFFQALKGKKNKGAIEWSEACQESLDELKAYLSEPRVLTQPKGEEDLYLYLSTSRSAASAVLTRMEDQSLRPVYFISEVYQGAQASYPKIEQLALALVISARKLRPYFHSHKIVVMTNQPLRQILQKPDLSGRLVRWAIELSEFDIEFRPRTAIKAQVIADFISELTPGAIDESKQGEWTLHVDGSVNNEGSGAGILLRDPEGREVQQAIRFSFQATNNEAEYEALIAGLELAFQAGAELITISCDSQLVVSQHEGSFEARSESMAKYLKKAKELMKRFRRATLKHVPRAENHRADALAKLASSLREDSERVVYIETLQQPSIQRPSQIFEITSEATWMDPIRSYLSNGTLPEDKIEARKIQRRAARYAILSDELYRRSYTQPLLTCVGSKELQKKILEEVHEGSCGIHCGGRSLAAKTLRSGHYWPTLRKDAIEYVEKCDTCQKNAPLTNTPPLPMQAIVSPWPFMIWGMDILGPFPIAAGQRKFILVAIDYFTRWIEAEPLATITAGQVQKFTWKNVICRYGIPTAIVSDNGKQFNNNTFISFCELYGIQNRFTSVSHPQTNGLAEKANHSILRGLKTKLDNARGGWADVLPEVLWSHRTTPNTATRETPYSLVYGTEAILPIEIGAPTLRTRLRSEERNGEALQIDLDLSEELRDKAHLHSASFKNKVARFHDKRVKQRRLKE